MGPSLSEPFQELATNEHEQALRATPVPPPVGLARAIELIEAESAYSQHRCAPPGEARRLGMRAERLGAATLILMRGSRSLTYNRVIALGQAAPATPRDLDDVIAAARAHRAKVLGIPRGNAARPGSLADGLVERGFRRGHPSAKLWRDGAPLRGERAPAGVRVRRVPTSRAGVWVDVVAAVWRTVGFRRPWFEARLGAPGWTHYLAWCEGRPVAAGALFVGDVGGVRVGHLVDGVTLGPWRRRGCQRAVIRRRISDGLAQGCELFTSETAPPLPRMPLVSFRNLCRQGFRLAYLRESWRLDLTPSLIGGPA